MFSQGDANCDGTVSPIDFEFWRNECFDQGGVAGLEKTNWKTDFNKDLKANLADFDIWRDNYF